MPYHPLTLEVSKVQKKELLLLMKSTRDKEEYRRAYAIKQKMEGVPYRTIAKDIGVNYRNVYDWIDNYRKNGLNGIRNKRKNSKDRIDKGNNIVGSPDQEDSRQFNPNIHRIGYSDNFECNLCPLVGDIHLMKSHICSRQRH